MVVYSINDIERLSGVKAHTLRIWEKRYGIIQPKRTNKNIRYFLDEDLKHILNIALLNKNGHRISKIARMSAEEIKTKALALTSHMEIADNEVESLTQALLDYNEVLCDQILEALIQKQGFENTMTEVIYPLLDNLGLLWLTGAIVGAQEHFIKNYIRQKLITAIDQLEHHGCTRTFFLVFLAENEDHELSLLFSQYLIKRRGFQVINLGCNTNIDHVTEACSAIHPAYLYTIINEGNMELEINEFCQKLASHVCNAKLLCSGKQVSRHDITGHENIFVLPNFKALTDYLDKLVALAS